ncbi:hypothetical protein J0H58_24425 [bacterium]|nr:hypothetical protein [bacterium]
MPADLTLRTGARAEEGGVAILTAGQFKEMMTQVQADPRSSVRQLPEVTAEDGVPASAQVGSTRTFTTGVEVSHAPGAPVLTPKTTSIHHGERLTICGRASADRTSVSTAVELVSTRVAGAGVDLIPVTTLVKPAGGAGEAIPITHYLEAPDIRTVRVKKAGLDVPRGGHAVITGPVGDVVDRQIEARIPVLSNLPVAGSMFRRRETERLFVRTLVVVSPRSVVAEDLRVGAAPAAPGR